MKQDRQAIWSISNEHWKKLKLTSNPKFELKQNDRFMNMFFLPKEPTYFFRSRIQDERTDKDDTNDFKSITKIDDIEVLGYFIRAMPKTSLPIGDFDENGQLKPDGKLYNLGIKSSQFANAGPIEQWANDKDQQLKTLINEIEDGCKNDDAFEEASSSLGGMFGLGDSDSDDDPMGMFGGPMMHGMGGGRGGGRRPMNEAARRRREDKARQKAEKERKKKEKDELFKQLPEAEKEGSVMMIIFKSDNSKTPFKLKFQLMQRGKNKKVKVPENIVLPKQDLYFSYNGKDEYQMGFIFHKKDPSKPWVDEKNA